MGVNRAHTSRFGRRRIKRHNAKLTLSEMHEAENLDSEVDDDVARELNLAWFYDDYHGSAATVRLDLAAADETLYKMGILYDTPTEVVVDPFPGIEVDRDWDMVSLAPTDGEGEWDVVSIVTAEDDDDAVADDWDERSVA